jgi:hypothetical protein
VQKREMFDFDDNQHKDLTQQLETGRPVIRKPQAGQAIRLGEKQEHSKLDNSRQALETTASTEQASEQRR